MSMAGEAEVTSFLLQTLKEVVTVYINTKSDGKLQFQLLNNELGILEAFIKDSNKRSEKTDVFREKERQIRELVYDVQDIIETCLTKKAAAKKSVFSGLCERFSINMEKQVKSLRRERVQPIVQDITKECDGRNVGMEAKKEQSLRQSSVEVFAQDLSVSQNESFKQDIFVEFEDQEIIINYLMEQKEALDVITITGMPGLGKTTLARRVFHDKEVAGEFQQRIWINISQKFDSREVFLYILKVLDIKTMSNPSDKVLISVLRRKLADMKFLLVLDDVWTTEDWEVIKEILPLNNSKGKVLVTSREDKVAWSASTRRTQHQMCKLGEKKSWELLKLIVFSGLDECDQKLEEIGAAIARKCGDSPLIIRVIGGILKELYMEKKGATPAVRSEWMKVSANMDEYLNNNKLISDAVELSYSQLSDELRVCFLYTGLFPENHEISASTLKQLWIAEGFIRPKPGNSSFEVTAHKFLHDLIRKNLLMVEKMRLDEVKSCRVHDAIREFCRAKAMKENFFTVVKPSVEGLQDSRRLCLHSDPSETESIFQARRVRSFICFFEWDEKHITTITDAFNLLRVLSCKSIKFKEFPKVKNLILLKHITLSIDYLNILPEEIYDLLNLQTLIIETSSHSIKVKKNVWEMMQLRGFKTKAAIFLLDDHDKKRKVEAHKNLQKMSRLSPESCTATLSDRACNLKTLGIQGKLANLFSYFSLEKFNHLTKLKLVNESTRSPLQRLPQQGCFPPKLERLTLSKTMLDWNTHMPMRGPQVERRCIRWNLLA